MRRFAYINGEFCVSVSALLDTMPGDRATTENTIKIGLTRSRKGSQFYRHYNDPIDARKKWLVFSSLPKATQGAVAKEVGDIEHEKTKALLYEAALNRVQDDDLEFFVRRRMPQDKAIDLSHGCGWMRLSSSDYWQNGWSGKMEFYEAVVKCLAPMNLFGMRVHHVASLRRKIRDWKKDGRESLLHGNAGRIKIQEEPAYHKRILDLYMSPLKPSKRDVYEMYLREAAERGWPEYTYQRIVQLLNAPQARQIAIIARHGEAAARQLMERTIKRSRPSFPDALWSIDGTTVQLLHLDERGKIASEMYIVCVTDAHSRDIVGYEVGSTETGALVQGSLRNAVRSSGFAPLQLQYDNSSANKSAEAQTLFTKLTKLAFPTAPYNGKSKVIEALYGHIEQGFLRHFPNFKGGNITAKSLDSRANPDLVRQLVANKEIPTKAEAIAQLRLAIETYRNTVVKTYGQTPREMYATQHPERRSLSKMNMISLLWTERAHRAAYTKDGITIEVNGVRHTYEVEKSRGVEDTAWRMQHLGERFRIMFDPDDRAEIALFDDEWRFVAMAANKWEAPMAKADSQPGDGAIIAESLQERQRYLDELRRKARQVREENEAADLPIVDFQLVHKDAFNRMEHAELDKLLADTARVVEYEEPKQRRRRKALYDDETADGSLID